MMLFPSRHCWRAEGLKLRRQPLAWIAIGALFLVLLASAISAGLDARDWRRAAGADARARTVALDAAVAQLQALPPGTAAAIATYQLGRGELGLTRMPVAAGLGLGIQRLAAWPTRLKASLESEQVDARDPGPLRNPLLAGTGIPGVPAMVALLLPLVALVLCSGLPQEEREHGRLGLLRVQSKHGIGPPTMAGLGWRGLCLWAVAAVATAPALLLDPGAGLPVLGAWFCALAAFTGVWVALGGLLGCTRLSGAGALLAAIGLWLLSTFAVPAAVGVLAERASPMPSRLASIVQIREAQQRSEAHEQELAQAWYAAHPGVGPHLPAVWPASFVARTLAQQEALRSIEASFDGARAAQAAFVARWAWLSPGWALVLWGERRAGTDTAGHVRYRAAARAFEDRWRNFLVPSVMARQGLSADALRQLPSFETSSQPAQPGADGHPPR